MFKTFLLCFIFSIFQFTFARSLENAPKKIVIFYSSIGGGHISAAKAIKEQVESQHSDAKVVLKRINDFQNPHPKFYKVDEKLFWYVVKNHPAKFDKLFRSAMKKGNEIDDIANLNQKYSLDKIKAFLVNENPTAIISTHYGSTLSLIQLRKQNFFKEVPVGWLHTDYFEGYFPRISEKIEKTFLPMHELDNIWKERGVNQSLTTVTGMPVNPSLFEEIDRDAFLTSEGLDPRVKTIMISTGAEGVGDYAKIVESVIEKIDGKIQIIANYARSTKNETALLQLQKRLPERITLKLEGFIPVERVLNFVKSSDIYISKTGGLSPAEGFALKKPLILLDIYGGHERDNANLFQKLGLAIINKDEQTIGADVQRLLSDSTLREKMIGAQNEFLNSINIDKIVNFAVNPLGSQENFNNMKPFLYGVENGIKVSGSAQALKELDQKFKPDVEVLLSFAKTAGGEYSEASVNPFGHIGIRVRDKVFSANGKAVLGEDEKLLIETSLDEYLYGVKRETLNQEFTDSFGSTYGRDVLSFRLKGIDPDQVEAMLEYAKNVNKDWLAGKAVWHKTQCNCANHVENILKAGGFDISVNRKLSMPLDVFQDYLSYFETKHSYDLELAMFSKVESKGYYQKSLFPLTPYKLKDSFRTLLQKNKEHPLLKRVSKTIKQNDQGTLSFMNKSPEDAFQENYFENKRLTKVYELRSELYLLEAEVESLLRKQKTEHVSAGEIMSIYGSLVDQGKDPLIDPQVKAWFAINEKTQGLIDQINLKQGDLLSLTSMEYVKRFYYQHQSEFSKSDKKKLIQSINQINKDKNNYFLSRKSYGGPKDHKRIISLRNTITNTSKFFELVQETSKFKESFSFRAVFKKYMKKIPLLLKEAMSMTKLFKPALKFLHSLFIIEKPNSNKSSSFIETINELGKAEGSRRGYTVEIEGKENLEPPKGNKSVTIYTPTHRHPQLDAFNMANLGIQNTMVVAAPDQFAPKVVAQRLEKQPNFIYVGKKSGYPVEQILEQLRLENSNKIFIYPEGSTANFQETRPLREKFSDSLLKELVDKGYQVNIVPITYTDSARFIETFDDVKKLYVKVHKPISPKLVEQFVKDPLNSKFSRVLIRSIWLESLETNEKQLVGQLKTNSILKSFLDYTTPKKLRTLRKFKASAPYFCELFLQAK